MKCPSCQADVDENSPFCPNCGGRLEQPSEPDPSADLGEEGGEQVARSDAAQGPGEEAGGAPRGAAGDEGATMSDRLRARAGRNQAERREGEAPAKGGWTEGGYSALALRGRFVLIALITLLCVVLGVWASIAGWKGWLFTATWIVLLLIPAVLWLHAICVFIYRVGTIRYRLTEARFYHEEGILRRVRSVVEVVDIDDLELERTLWDRMINGGVGTVVIHSTDQSDPVLKLRGLRDPEMVFEAIDDARREQRAQLGLKSI